MSIQVLFAAHEKSWGAYKPHLEAAFRQYSLDVNLTQDASEEIEYIIYAPDHDLKDFSHFPKLRAVLSLWAGVEKIIGNPTLNVPLCRMVDDGLKQGMIDYVTGHVLRYHLGLDQHIKNKAGVWLDHTAPDLASSKTVGILGLGSLGLACGEALLPFGFEVTGWSRSPKEHDHIRCFSGKEGLSAFLSQADMVVVLLPLTPETRGLLNAEHFAHFKKGAYLINAARGPIIDESAVLAALDQGQIAHATLDVFNQEPLPANHPFWAHPNITITPHIASVTRPKTASEVIAQNISLDQNGKELLFRVNKLHGY